eukprot:2305032-Rhodomonas_salina.5
MFSGGEGMHTDRCGFKETPQGAKVTPKQPSKQRHTTAESNQTKPLSSITCARTALDPALYLQCPELRFLVALVPRCHALISVPDIP